MSCDSSKNDSLPIISLRFADLTIPALLDTGANISLIEPQTLSLIKEQTKVHYLSRSVKIHTIDNNSVPYLSAVSSKFKINTKWFSNVFFVTQNNWRYKYKIILGYDFIQSNKLLLDIPNKQLIMGNDKFDFVEESPSSSNACNNVNKIPVKEVVARNCEKIILEPNSHEIVKLKVPETMLMHKNLILTPCKNKLNYTISDSLYTVQDGYIITIIENNHNKSIVINKDTKIGILENFDINDVHIPEEEGIFQINNLSMQEVIKLRKEELKETDFALDHLNVNDRNSLLEFLMENSRVFSKSYKTLGSTDAVTPEFNLLHSFPIQTKPYPIPNIAKKFARQEIQALLEAGIIEPSSSNYNFPIIFVKKKPYVDDPSKQKFRMVIDYRLLNSVTQSFKICLPKITDILHKIAGNKFYCVLDLKSAFFQIKLRDEDKHKLAFCCELGNFQPLRLPFGSLNSTSYFHTLISKCLNDLKGSNVQYFLDDIIIAGNSINEVRLWLQKVFDRLIQFNLTLDPAKLQLCKEEITYLGFNIHKDGFSPSEDNVKKILNLPIPKNVKQVQSFIGMVNYFRHLILNFAHIIQPIVKLTKKDTPFIWNDDCQEAFNLIQHNLLQKPTLKNISESQPFYLVTDASQTALCGILMQKYQNKFFPVEFFSRQLSSSESKYPSIRRELLGIYESVKHFHEHLFGRSFIILTDAKPLTFHTKLDKQPEIVARWLMYLQQFNFKMEHIQGLKNPADYLSRVVDPECVVNNLNIFQTNSNLTNENICKHQWESKDTKSIIDKLNENDEFISSKFYIDKDSKLLMIKINPPKYPHRTINRIFIPNSLIKDCLTVAHAPHFGLIKTYEFLKKNYSWYGMFRDAKNFCSNCEACLANKPKSKLTASKFIPKGDLAVGEMISIDIVGKLPRSHDCKFYILTIIDHFSRYLEAIPLNNIKSSTIIQQLNKYFAQFGIPKILLTDNGSNFVSSEFEEFLTTLNIEHRKSSIYYPQSNGLIERTHRIMKESLSAMSNSVCEWSERLLFFKLHYNSSKHAVTKFSPAEIFFGRNLNLPSNILQHHTNDVNVPNYIKLLKNHILETREMVKYNENEYFNKHVKYIKGRAIPDYNIGDKVFLQIPDHCNTFCPKYDGPHTITRKLRNNNYLIKIQSNDRDVTKKYHVSKLFRQMPLNDNFQNDNVMSLVPTDSNVTNDENV